MQTFLFIFQIIIALLLIILIMIQPRGMGLGTGSGGEGLAHSPKGVEKVIFIATVVLAALFLIITLGNIFISRI